MARAVEAAWTGDLSGLVVTRYGHGAPTTRIEVVEASHPVPDAAGEAASRRILGLVAGLTPDDLALCLISGGASALLSLPAPGLTLSDKQAVNRALPKSGAAIGEMNCVRRHLSGIKGGRLAAACHPARGGDAADLRHARRRSPRHRLQPDCRGPHHLRRRAGDPRPLPDRGSGGRAPPPRGR